MAIHKDLAAAVSRAGVVTDDYTLGNGPDDGSTCATCLKRVEPPVHMTEHGCDGYEGLWVRWDGSYNMGYCQLCDDTMPRRTPLNSLSSVLVWHDCHLCERVGLPSRAELQKLHGLSYGDVEADGVFWLRWAAQRRRKLLGPIDAQEDASIKDFESAADELAAREVKP